MPPGETTSSDRTLDRSALLREARTPSMARFEIFDIEVANLGLTAVQAESCGTLQRALR
jgi:hypothetical protein